MSRQQPEISAATTTTPSPSSPWSDEKQSTSAVNDSNAGRTVADAEKRVEPSVQPGHEQQYAHNAQALESGLHRSSDELSSNHSAPLSRITTDADGNTYPEGGREAWLVVFGSFMGLFGSLGLVNSIGTFQAYIEDHQLKEYSSGNNGWIFSMFAFLTFFCGVQIGPVFDAKGPRFLVIAGSVLIMAMMIGIGFCTQYWHFMLAVGVAGGIGSSLLFTPAISAVGHFFSAKRGIATGIAATGGSVGGVIFPLILQDLFSENWLWVGNSCHCLNLFDIADSRLSVD